MADLLHAAALRLLTARALSEKELVERLQRRGFSPAAVAAEVAQLRELGLLDDVRLAAGVCADLLRRGYGRRRLAAALARRGVSEEAAGRVLAEVSPEEELAAFERAVERISSRSDDNLTLPREPAKVIRYLLARGFPAALVCRVGGSMEHGQTSRSTADDE